jgi:hypothetical protein
LAEKYKDNSLDMTIRLVKGTITWKDPPVWRQADPNKQFVLSTEEDSSTSLIAAREVVVHG